MAGSAYRVCRASYDLEDPWKKPACAPRERLARAADGGVSRLETEFFAYHDSSMLYVVFTTEDDDVVATHLEHDAPLWEEDVVEVFLAPDSLKTYYEIEVNPLATTFDARIESPGGDRRTMRTDVSWTCEGLRAFIRSTLHDGQTRVETLIAIPFVSVVAAAPSPGTSWRANFFRIDRSPKGDEFLCWRPTLRTPPDFHVPSVFGELVFV